MPRISINATSKKGGGYYYGVSVIWNPIGVAHTVSKEELYSFFLKNWKIVELKRVF